jgi:hypothetical protein
MAVIKSGASSNQLTIDGTSLAARATIYDTSGNATGSEVGNANTQAKNATIWTPRPIQVGSGTVARLHAESGAIAATPAAGNAFFSFRWTSGSQVCLIKQVRISASVSAAITTAVSTGFGMKVQRSFTANDSGQTTVAFSAAKSNTLRTSMAAVNPGLVIISNTGAITAGTRTGDTNYLAGVTFGTGTAVGTTPLAQTIIFDADGDDEWPLILAQNEGFTLEWVQTGHATGSIRVGVDVRWVELASY